MPIKKLLLFLSLSLYCHSRTVFLIEVFRHGARTPLLTSEETNSDFKRLGPGQLTLVGLKQHFLLGSQIRKAYRDFIPERYSTESHKLFATSVDRTNFSLLAHMTGMYPWPKNEKLESLQSEISRPPLENFKEFQTDFNSPLPHGLTPFSYNVVDTPHSYSFTPFCAKLDQQFKSRVREVQLSGYDFEDLHADFEREGLVVRKGLKIEGVQPVRETCDLVISRSFSDPKSPFSQNLLEKCSILALYFELLITQDRKLSRANLTPIFREILERLPGSGDESLRVLSFSGHDTNLAFLSNFLWKNNSACVLNRYFQKFVPKKFDPRVSDDCLSSNHYASSFLFEVFEDSSSSLKVKILYNGENLPFSGGRKSILLSEFKDMLKNEIDPSFDSYCSPKMVKKPSSSFLKFLTVLTSSALIIFLIYACWIWLETSRNEKGHHHRIVSDDIRIQMEDRRMVFD